MNNYLRKKLRLLIEFKSYYKNREVAGYSGHLSV
ncbi:MAG: hypothetical protein BWY95_01387 [Bacteroidetes bacterium ADurb.BinA104]|nr:MAG: hypothetical protein BWY95_01387 [Bacteroidetes bacterium ADurb.BinA104]